MLFLPTTAEDVASRGWEELDFVYISGDAYVDHPSFGTAIISRMLEAKGFKVGILAQPDWRNPASITALGRPRLGFLVSAGNMDSMVNQYTVAKRRRSRDAYSPGGACGLRPDRAVIVYCNLIRHTFKDTPIIVGGIEASLRRLAHYDYWDDRLRRSILLDSGADLVSYGMGEHSIVEIAEALEAGIPIEDVTFVNGTVWRAHTLDHVYDAEALPSWEEMQTDPVAYARSFARQYAASDPFSEKRLYEPYDRQGYIVQNPPASPLTQEELDAVYRLPYTYAAHPSYDACGGVPALEEVQFSLASSRGCFGECSFCALAFHQGRIVQGRSRAAVVDEAKRMVERAGFKGNIHDVGGPTANFFRPACAKQASKGACLGRRCLSPKPCKNLVADHAEYTELLRELREIEGVKRVFVRSGVRFDYVLEDCEHGQEFLEELATHHVSGQLRVAPEHVSERVLSAMGKPPVEVYERFVTAFNQASRAAGKEQYVVPYLMSSHPGSTLEDAIELAEFCLKWGFRPEQVQDFYPTPSTMSTVMYYTGLDPRTMEPVHVPRDPHEKAMQRALIQFRDRKNHALVIEALTRAGRTDLIGFGPNCLIRPSRGRTQRRRKRNKQ